MILYFIQLSLHHAAKDAVRRWYTLFVQNERSLKGGSLGLGATAALSIIVLVSAIGWRFSEILTNRDSALTVVASAATGEHSSVPANNPQGVNPASGAATTASSDPYAPGVIGDNLASALALEYTTLKANGTYSTTTAAAAARSLGASIKATVTFKTYAYTDIPTVSDTSYGAMLTYRAALQGTLKPLMTNTGPELDLLTKYEETHDPSYLTKLRQASGNYKLAAAGTAQIRVPSDAISVQIGILNAMQEFAATLDQMVASADDALTEATLINTYLQAQQHMISSFNSLYGYYKSKQQ